MNVDIFLNKKKDLLCKYCETVSANKNHYEKHLLTAKHKKRVKCCHFFTNILAKNYYECPCGKYYIHRQSLSVHKKTCKIININLELENSVGTVDISSPQEQQSNVYLYNDKTIQELIVNQQNIFLENQELKSILFELSSKPPTQTIINNNYNGNTTNIKQQQFNLNFFLNETCKDAMSVDEFINTLVITDAELEDFGKLGYVQGISNILIRGLKELGEHHRPIHNTDRKRNVLYMKYKEGWEKEVDEPLVFKNYLPTEIPKMTVRRMIYRISKKGFFGMNTWKQNNPTHSDITTKKHEEYMVLLHQLMCGHEPPDSDISKIVKIVSEKTLFITKR